jgi:alpha-N-arabinofuranosidase
LERNADIVPMATYAPLLAHKDAWQWKPDLIWFDNRSLVLTPNYYVQQMYSTYAGNRILPLAGEDGKPLAGQKGLYGSSVFDGERKSIIVKLVNMNPSDCTIQLNFKGQDEQIPKGSGIAIRLHSDNIETQNNFEKPDNIRPVSTILPALEKNRLDLRIPAYSFGVYVFPAE